MIAERTAEGVRIQLAFGHLVLPADQVLSLEKADSPLAAYLERKAALAARPEAGAEEWLALARWSKANEINQGAREAAMAAAEIDPRLPGLDPLLRPFGLVFDEEIGRWVPYEEAMTRRGLVRFEGQWITRDEQRLRLAELQRERALAAEEATARRLAALTEVMVAREEREALEEVVEPAEMPWYGLPYWYGWGGGVVVHGGFVHRPRDGHFPRHDGGIRPPPGHHFGGVFDRVPGSLLPIAPQAPSRPVSSSTGPSARSGS